MSEIFTLIQNWSKEIVRTMSQEDLMELLLQKVFDRPHVYSNEHQVYSSSSYVIPGYSPFFNSDKANRSAITPDGCPKFVKFPQLVGAFQHLNSDKFWDALIARVPIAGNLKGSTIESGNRNLLKPYFTLLPVGIVYGSRLDEVLTPFDKTYFGYKPVKQLADGYDGVVRDEEELHERLMISFGNNDQQGRALQLLMRTEGMSRCPGNALTGYLMTTLGEMVHNKDIWDLMAINFIDGKREYVPKGTPARAGILSFVADRIRENRSRWLHLDIDRVGFDLEVSESSIRRAICGVSETGYTGPRCMDIKGDQIVGVSGYPKFDLCPGCSLRKPGSLNPFRDKKCPLYEAMGLNS